VSGRGLERDAAVAAMSDGVLHAANARMAEAEAQGYWREAQELHAKCRQIRSSLPAEAGSPALWLSVGLIVGLTVGLLAGSL